jgi:hypothetical protein
MFLISLVDVKLYLIFGKGLLKICNRYSRGLRLLSLNLELLVILSMIVSAIDKKWLLKEFEVF